MVITLPWPPSALSPNSRMYWRKKNPIKVAYREECYRIVKAGQKNMPTGFIPVEITFCPPNARPRDLDNCLAAAKSGIDGLCQALGINDKNLRPITIDFGPIKRNGEVQICLKI